MDKLDMESVDIVDENIEKIGNLFPNVIVESDKGKSIDFNLLKQELSKVIVDDSKEKYQLTWPGKKESIVNANTPSTNTLRPLREKSVDFDSTQNIYIEGDNLEALKILQESYLNKVKCIYIDPPYNTGNDFIYNDKFDKTAEGELEESGQIDELGNKLISNNTSNGRFHSDWLSMIYSRIKLSRNLLTDDGVIIISIDDHELENLKKVCNEIYGENNFVGCITWLKKRKGSFLTKGVISLTEYLLIYQKSNKLKGLFGGKADSNESQPIVKRKNKKSILKIQKNQIAFKIPDGTYSAGIYGDNINPIRLLNDLIVSNGINTNDFGIEAPFVWSQEMFNSELKKGTKAVINTNNMQIRVFRKYDDDNFKGLSSIIYGTKIKGTNEDAYEELKTIFENKTIFDYSKPSQLLKYLINAATYFDKNSIILDFFSGSATTAHSIMKLNAEDGGNRKYILIQLPEECNEKTEAYKDGYKTICDIGEERIRRAGKKIKEEINADIDYGFRVYKIDSSNMKDVFYKPNDINQNQLRLFESNIKEDRTNDDLLTQVILDLGLTLDLNIEEKQINGNKVYYVDNNSLVACFDNNIDINVVDEIAKCKPLKVVFKDESFKLDNDKINLMEKFKKLSPETEISIL